MLLEKKLDNGVTFTIVEQSRPIAADRWYVKVVGVISLPLTEAAFKDFSAEDPVLLTRVRRHLGEAVEQRLVKERNFVDAAIKDEVVGELAGQLVETIGSYLEVESFPVRFLARKYREVKEICRVEMGRETAGDIAGVEPADFSHCFK